ncbi:MAG: 30S ribosomal protein S7 [Patescibacteria group bacterium]
MRKKRKYKKEIEPDHKHNSPLITKLINSVMKDGKKTIAEKIVYGALDKIQAETQKDPMEIFDLAMKNISPFVELRSRRVGGANYQVPKEVRGERKLTLTLRWLLGAARAKKGKSMIDRLAGELILASKNEGEAIRKKMNTHKMAEANKAFAHFSW